MEASGDATQILKRLSAGDPEAGDQLVGLIYDQLHDLAAGLMRRERPDHTLQATALVNEAYLKLVDKTRVQWRDRAHFLAVAAKVMRRILIDHARHHGRAKRGGGRQSIPFDELATRLAHEQDWDLVSLDEALKELESADPQRAQIVELRYFGDLTVAQVAEVLQMPIRSVERSWHSARTWLYRALADNGR